MRAWFRFVAFLMASGLITALLVIRVGFSDRLETRPASRSEAKLDRLWFGPEGQLIGLGRHGPVVTVVVWGAQNQKIDRQHVINLAPWAGRGGTLGPLALSLDGERLAWISGQTIYIRNLATRAGGTSQRALRSGDPPVAVAFTESRHLGVLTKNGRLDLLNPTSGAILSSAEIDAKDLTTLESAGTFLATWSPARSEVFVFDARREDRLALVEYTKHPFHIASLGLSSSGRAALGSEAGSVQTIQLLSAPGAVRAVSFYDDNRVVAAGEFKGVYLLDPKDNPTELISTASGETRAVAASPWFLAFSGGQGTTVLTHQWISKLNNKGIFLPSVWLFLAFLGLAGPLLKRVFLRFLNAKPKKDEKAKKSPVTKRDVPDPNLPPDLVVAFAAGDCILHAGSGLSAQAGLPVWRDYLSSLVEWAVQVGLGGPSFGEDRRRELDEGNWRAAADQIGEIFAEHRASFFEFLSRSFPRSTPLSTVHQVLPKMPFGAVVTTNFDNLLERSLAGSVRGPHRVYTLGQGALLRGALVRREFFLLKPYGALDKPSSLIVGQARYAAAVSNDLDYRSFLEEMYFSRNVLFIGSSFDGIEAELKTVVFDRTIPERHYAVVAVSDTGWRDRARSLQRRYGVRVLAYVPSDTTHSEAFNFIEKMSQSVRRVVVARV